MIGWLPLGRLVGHARWATARSTLDRVDAAVAALLVDPPRAIAFAGWTALVFVCYTGQLLLVASALGQSLDPAAAWGALGLGIIVGVLSLLPFGLGSADLVVAGLLVAAGVPGREAVAITFGYRLVSTLPLGPARCRLVRVPVRAPAPRSRQRGSECRQCRPGWVHAPPGRVDARMSIAVVVLVIAAFVAATLLVRPAAERTGLAIWHPAIWWLALTAVFFGIGSARLAIDGRFGPAAYVSGAVLAFALAVAAGDRLARRRAAQDGPPTRPRTTNPRRRSPCGHGSSAVSPPSGWP